MTAPPNIIAATAQDTTLTFDEKVTRISYAVSANGGAAAQYYSFKRGHKAQLDTLKESFDKVAGSKLLKSIEDVMESVLAKGLDVGTGAQLGITVLRDRATAETDMLAGIIAQNAPLAETFRLMQAAEASMIGLANGTREETRLALITLDNQKKESAKLLNRQQDESDAIGMIEKVLDDVRSHHLREKDKTELRGLLKSGLATDRPVTAPPRARFRRNMAKI